MLGLVNNYLPITLCTLLSVACASDNPSAPSKNAPLQEVSDSGIGYRSTQDALDALKKKSGTQIYQQRDWTLVKDQESENVYSLWSFTPEGHPAHPAVVKRTSFKKDGAVYLEMKVLCGATKESCDTLVREFQELNERIKEDMRRPKQ